jgi:Zn finger protein HypA/HybF involved in hydrogenase expression
MPIYAIEAHGIECRNCKHKFDSKTGVPDEWEIKCPQCGRVQAKWLVQNTHDPVNPPPD